MARPRKASDPDRWPLPCARCGEHHEVGATWPDGRVCRYCYQKAKRTRGTCPCGHEGVLPGRIYGHPACRGCSGVKLNVDCKTCGAEDELYRGGRCWSCELATLADQLLTNPDTGEMTPELAAIAQALKSMKRANSGVTWIRQPHVTDFLKALATAPNVTHQTLDQLPGADRTREYIRGLLLQHAALPRRDELAVRYEQWVANALDRVSSDDHRDVVRQYVRWHVQRRMNQMEEVPQGTFLRSKQTVTVTIDFLNWLHDHGLTLQTLRQDHLDAWLATGPSTRRFVDRFLPWAIKSRLAHPDLAISPHRRGTSTKMPATEQDAVVERVVHTDELTMRDRAASILVVVFGQQVEDVVKLTWDDVIVTDDVVNLKLGKTQFALPSPLDEPMRQLAAAPALTAAHPHSGWVFRGRSPGRHIEGSSLRARLKTVFSTRAARLGTLQELSKLGPIPIIADALGYHPSTIERHAASSASAYAEYIASARTQRQTS